MKNKKTLKFYIAIFIAKCASFTLKLLKRNATYMPGKIALQLCPYFLGMLEKPETIIGVTDFLNVSALVRAKDPITFSRFWTAKLQFV